MTCISTITSLCDRSFPNMKSLCTFLLNPSVAHLGIVTHPNFCNRVGKIDSFLCASAVRILLNQRHLRTSFRHHQTTRLRNRRRLPPNRNKHQMNWRFNYHILLHPHHSCISYPSRIESSKNLLRSLSLS